jgi:hypothetical protein
LRHNQVVKLPITYSCTYHKTDFKYWMQGIETLLKDQTLYALRELLILSRVWACHAVCNNVGREGTLQSTCPHAWSMTALLCGFLHEKVRALFIFLMVTSWLCPKRHPIHFFWPGPISKVVHYIVIEWTFWLFVDPLLVIECRWKCNILNYVFVCLINNSVRLAGL